MRSSNKTCVIVGIIAIFVNCHNYNNTSHSSRIPPKETLVWKCHQNYLYVFDTQIHDSCLCIIGYPNQEYPGLELDWLKSPWSHQTSLTIPVKALNPTKTDVSLLLFDGIGAMEYNNRFQTTLTTSGNWDTIYIDLKNKLTTPSGRTLDLSKKIQAVLFTQNPGDTLKFCMDKITLQ
jgi:hypothetical protein